MMEWAYCLSSFLICFTVVTANCLENGNCETCKLTMSTSLKSTNDTIRITQGENITFIVNFQQRGHNGFTFAVNDEVFNTDKINPNFTCTSEKDTPNLTQTLEVQYHCIVVEPGSYSIKAYVYYCGNDYFAQTFTVIVENAAAPPSPTPAMLPLTPLTSIPSSRPSMRPSMPLVISSTPVSTTPPASSFRIQTNTTTFVSPSSTTGIDIASVQNGGNNNTVVIVICVFTGLILAAVLVIILLMRFKRVPKTMFCCSLEQPIPGIRNQQQLPYDSETSNETNETDFHIPVDVTSEPVTQDHHDASTPHQLIIMP